MFLFFVVLMYCTRFDLYIVYTEEIDLDIHLDGNLEHYQDCDPEDALVYTGHSLFIITNTLSILAFLDLYGIWTVPLYLSTSVNESLIPYRSVQIQVPEFCGSRSGTNYSGTFWVVQFIMWTGGWVPFRNRHGRIRFRTDPNCTGTVVPLQMW